MKAKITSDCGVLGSLMYVSGQHVEVQPFIGPDGPIPDLYQDRDGCVWPANLLSFDRDESLPDAKDARRAAGFHHGE
jgi:hypothetical protein